MIYPAYKWGGGGYSKSEVDTLLNSKSDTSHTHTKSQITDFPSYGTTANTICEGNDSRLSDARTPTAHTHSASDITSGLATVATSGSYNDLSNKPSIPSIDLRPQANADANTVSDGVAITHYGSNGPATSLGATTNDGALFQQCWSSAWKIQIAVDYRNGNLFTRGKDNGTWTAWRAVAYHGDKVSKFTNDAGYLTSHQSLSNYSTLANTIKSLSISGKTITYTKGDDTTGTLTTQDTTYSNFVKSGSGAKAGLVPAPSTTAGTTKYLREDGTWQVPPVHTYTVNNATLTIQKNGSNVATVTSNASSNVIANITVPTKTSDLTNDSGFLTSADRLPIGSYIQFAGSQAPDGFLVCNGGEISRTTYSALFAVIGTTYGSGDGSTTFNLPNLTDRFLQGSTTSGTVKNAGLPNIKGNNYALYWMGSGDGKVTGAFYSTRDLIDEATVTGTNKFGQCDVKIDASRSSSIYGNSTTVQPPALTCLICIKY